MTDAPEAAQHYAIFISYEETTGLDLAGHLKLSLEKRRIQSFVARRDLEPYVKNSAEWRTKIDGVIRTVNTFILILSTDSLTPEVVREASLAFERSKIDSKLSIIICHLENAPRISEQLSLAGIEAQNYQQIDFDSKEDLARKVGLAICSDGSIKRNVRRKKGKTSSSSEGEGRRKLRFAFELRNIVLSSSDVRDAFNSRRASSRVWRCVVIFYLGTWLPNYPDPTKMLNKERRYFTLYRDLKKVAKDHGLLFDISRSEPPRGFLRAVEESFGYVKHGRRKKRTIWYITEEGDEYLEKSILKSLKAKPKPALPALLAVMDAAVTRFREQLRQAKETKAEHEDLERKRLLHDPLSKDEGRKLAYEFLKCMFRPDPDYWGKLQEYRRSQWARFEEYQRSQHAQKIKNPIQLINEYQDFLNWSHLHGRNSFPQIPDLGKMPEWVRYATSGGKLERFDELDTFEVEDALSSLQEKASKEFVDALRRRLFQHTCKLQHGGYVEWYKTEICGHTVRSIAGTLSQQGFPIKEEDWSFLLLDPIPFKNEDLEKLRRHGRLMSDQREREAGFRTITCLSWDLVARLAYDAKDLGYILVDVADEAHVQKIAPLARKLSKMGLARFFKETPSGLSFYVGTWILRRIAKELWESGAFFRLILPYDWRTLATRPWPGEQS